MKTNITEEEQKTHKEIEKYNGYTNFETWTIALIIDNDESLLNEVLEIMAINKKSQYEIIDYEDSLKEYIEGISFEEFKNKNLIKESLLSCALGRVNFRQLAFKYKSEYQERLKERRII